MNFGGVRKLEIFKIGTSTEGGDKGFSEEASGNSAGPKSSLRKGRSFSYMPGKIDLTNVNRRKKMKKFWIVLLSVGLIVALAAPVLAVDVKFSGTYIIQGYYDSNRALASDDTATRTTGGDSRQGASQSDIWQRLRLQTDFQVAEGLKLTTRADIMERIWGAPRSGGATSQFNAGYPLQNLENDGEAQNIKMENVYVSANILGGLFRAGYQTQKVWGTSFGDSGDFTFGPRIRYDYSTGPWTFIALYDWLDGSKVFSTSQAAGAQVDDQADAPAVAFVYTWSKGNAGLLIQHVWSTGTSNVTSVPADNGYKTRYTLFLPYWKAQIGPVYTEGEIIWRYGKVYAYEDTANNTTGDVVLNGWSGYAMAQVDVKPAYVGAAVVYVEGNAPAASGSPNTTNSSGQAGGSDFNPCLMFFNYDLSRWNGGMGNGTYIGSAGNAISNPAANGSSDFGISNAIIVQGFVGVKPIPKLDVKLAGTWARADKAPAVNFVGFVSKDYGYEADLTATYKIYDNLSYMVGFGYLWAGDFWKGTQPNGTVSNDYLLTHKLTLSF
jgi:hypothetical protein